MQIQIPSDYEWNEPPKVFCETDIYHPNINTREGGSSIVCLNLLHYGTWDRKFGLEGVVLGLVYLLHHPNLASPLYVVETWDKETFEKNVAKYMRGESVAGRKFSAEFLKKLDDPKKTKSRRDSKPDEQAGGNDTASNSAAVDSNDEKLERLLKALEELGVTEETVPQDEPYEDFIDDIRAQITELERSESVESIDSAGSGVVFDERGNDRWSYHYGRDNSYDSTVCGE